MFTPIDYLLIGHMTADLIPGGRILGGTVSYAAHTAASFGLGVGVVTSAATDEPLVAELPDAAQVKLVPAKQTSTFENLYTPEGRVQYLRGRAGMLDLASVPEVWRSAPIVHIAPLTDEIDYALVHQFSSSTVLLTVQGWLRRWDADGRVHFKRWCDPDVLRGVDILVCSEEDIAPAPDLEAEYAALVPHVFITRGERGGTYYQNNVPSTYDTPQVMQFDPTGAGDIFAASLLAAAHRLKLDLRKAVTVAARLGALSVTRRGLLGVPSTEEVEEALKGVGEHDAS